MKVYSLTTHEQIEQLAEQFPHRLIVIDFWAPWCGPCMEMKSTFSELATQHQDGIFISVNIDADVTEEIKRVYNIQSIPLFVFIKNHKVIDMMMGANKSELLNKINKNLKAAVERDPLERMDKTNYQVNPGQSTEPPPISQAQPQQMQSFHQNPYEPPQQQRQQQQQQRQQRQQRPPISQSEMPPPPPQPQMQNPQRLQQPNSNINGNMSGLPPQYTQPQQQQEYNGPVDLPPELYNF